MCALVAVSAVCESQLYLSGVLADTSDHVCRMGIPPALPVVRIKGADLPEGVCIVPDAMVVAVASSIMGTYVKKGSKHFM